jgi:hypothetical protein
VDPTEPSANDPGTATGGGPVSLETVGVTWPAHRLAGPIARVRALVSAWGSLQTREDSPSPADLLAGDQYGRAYAAALCEARTAFAGANGWRLAASPFSADQLRTGRQGRLPCDYAAPIVAELTGVHLGSVDYFRTARRRPVGVVLHLEGAVTPAPIAGLSLVQLPASWFSPRGATAYLLAMGRR